MRRGAAFLVGIVVLAAIGGGAVLLKQNVQRPELRGMVVAALERRTGQPVSLGAVRLRLLPWPRLQADGLVIGDVLRVAHLSAGVGVWPLLHHVIRLDPLSLDQVTLHLVRDAAGRSNWEIRPHPARVAAGDGGSADGGRWRLEIGGLRVKSAELSLQDAQTRSRGVLHLTSLAASALDSGQPKVSLAGIAGGANYVVQGETGPVRLLLSRAGSPAAWPVALRASEMVAGTVVGRMQVTGTVSDPLHVHGYDLAITLQTAQLAALNRLFPHADLPPMQDLEASGHLVDSEHPSFVSLQAKAGLTVLRRLRGVIIRSWSVAAPTLDVPLRVAATGSWQTQPLMVTGSVASLRALDARLFTKSAAVASSPVRLLLGLGSSRLRIDGAAGSGASDVRVQGVLPDARALWPRSPDFGPLTVEAHLLAEQGTVFRVSGLRVLSAAGDLAGTLTLSLQGRPKLSGDLRATRIDADRLARSPPHSLASAETPAASGRASASTHAASPAAGLPWPILRMADADLSLQTTTLLAGGGTWNNLATHLALSDGRLLLDPLRANGSEARLEADAGASPPTLRLWMHPLWLPAGLLARWFDVAPLLAGNVELVGQIDAEGSSVSDLVASAAGHLGLSMTDGTLSNAAFSRLAGASPVFAISGASGGTTALRCLALHAAVGNNQALVDTLSLHTARMSLEGQGRAGLIDGTLDLHLLAGASVGRAAVSAPVRLQGTIQDPHVGFDATAPAHRYGLTIGADDSATAQCEVPLRSAREGVAGPPSTAIAAGSAKRKAPKPIDILRSLGMIR